MKISFVAMLLVLLGASLPGWDWLVRVREHNAAQLQAQAAAQRGHAAEAAWLYARAVALAGRGGPTPALLLNQAQAQAQAGQTAGARATYGRLLSPAVPAAIGSAARQQLAGLLATEHQFSQAIGLLRQALRLDPTNAEARYNYELLSQYVAGQRPPALPPAGGATPTDTPPTNQPKKDPTAPPDAGRSPAPAPTPGTNRPGEVPDPSTPPAGGTTGAPQPGPTGQPDQRPTPQAGTNASGGTRPGGTGPARPVPTGTAGGTRQGLDASNAALGNSAPAGQGRRPGTEAATDADQQLQTQRERLKAMDLTPVQAQQLLDALRASEQQYLQQRPRPRAGTAPPPGQPTW
jgi:tetratricopeptide (TPR) repeat protein